MDFNSKAPAVKNYRDEQIQMKFTGHGMVNNCKYARFLINATGIMNSGDLSVVVNDSFRMRINAFR